MPPDDEKIKTDTTSPKKTDLVTENLPTGKRPSAMTEAEPMTMEQIIQRLTSTDEATLQVCVDVMRDIVAEENRRDELTETRALGLLQTAGVGVTLVAGLLAYLTGSSVAGASLLIPILAVAAFLLIKAMYRGLMTVRPRNHGRPSIQVIADVQGGSAAAASKRYISELHQILDYNKKRTNIKLYHYHCCLVNVALFMLFALIFGASVLTVVLLKPTLDATVCYVVGAALLTISVFIDFLVVHTSNVWDFIRDNE